MTFTERDDHPTLRIDDYYQPIAQFTKCEYTLDVWIVTPVVR